MKIPEDELIYHSISCVCHGCLQLDRKLARVQSLSFGEPLYIYYHDEWNEGEWYLKKITMTPAPEENPQWKITSERVNNDFPVS